MKIEAELTKSYPRSLKIYSSEDFPTYLPKLSLLYDDLFAGGKGFRAKLIQQVCSHLAVPASTVHLLAQTIEFVHNASLLHDDLVDRSQLRRGKPAAWTKYTPEYAVLAGDYLLARVMVNLSAHGNLHLVSYTAQIISDLLEGEWLQDSVVGDFFVTLEQLDRIHHLKTASLFKWCIRAPFISREMSDDPLHGLLEELGNLLGLLFQRGDDLLDYDIRNDEGKAILGDLKSGYMNSFGAFLARDRSPREIDAMVRAKDLPELYSALGGKVNFDHKLAAFDDLNKSLIQLFEHKLEQLQSLLESRSVDGKGLGLCLQSLPDLLYWRKKPQG